MICSADAVLKIAAEEIGYKEKKSNKDLDSKTANAGSGNYTKYARDTKGFWGDKQGANWCTTFVLWCIMMACYKSPAEAKADGWKDMKSVQPFGQYGASCKWQTDYYKKAGRWSDSPAVGYQAFFTRGHTGIVEKVGDNTMTLIEGNCGNEVRRRVYAWPDPQFSGFGKPRYAAAPTVSPTVAKPVVTASPKDVSVVERGTAKFTVKASGTGLTYQWQWSKTGLTWDKCTLSGYTTPTLTVNAEPHRNGYRYRCIVKNSGGSVTSGSAKLTIGKKPAITKNPASVAVIEGETAKFSVTATGSGLSYLWYISTDSGSAYKVIADKTGSSMSVAASLDKNGYMYRCSVINKFGEVLSSPAKLSVKAVPKKEYSAVVTPDIGLNVRKGPGTAYAKIGALQKGTKITVLDEKNGWGRIDFNGKDGWVSLQYAKKA